MTEQKRDCGFHANAHPCNFQYPQPDRFPCNSGVSFKRGNEVKVFQYPQPDRFPCNHDHLLRRGCSVLAKLARQGLYLASQRAIFPLNISLNCTRWPLISKIGFCSKTGGICEKQQAIFPAGKEVSWVNQGINRPNSHSFTRTIGGFRDRGIEGPLNDPSGHTWRFSYW